MESHLVRIINRLEAMTKDGGNLKRNFEREGVVVATVVAPFHNSITPIADKRELSLIMVINSFPSAGRIFLIACGKMT